ncbi:hypothetical protein Hanom_Chr03g00185751 [Helianthus anomalus]
MINVWIKMKQFFYQYHKASRVDLCNSHDDTILMGFCDCIQVDNNGVGKLGDSEVGGSDGGGEAAVNWQNARYKAELHGIDAQLAQSQHVVAKYSGLAGQGGNLGDDKELDQFMVRVKDCEFPHYVLLLCSFKEQLQHVRVHAMEAVMVCWEIEYLVVEKGVSPGEGTGATMSDDDDDQVDSDANLFDGMG